METEKKLYALLFWKGEPIKKKRLGEILKIKDTELEAALASLKEKESGGGVVVLDKGDEVTLGTAPELSEFFEKLQKEEIDKDLSKASLETLSIILYKNGANRAEIDYIRGVNSSFTLRALSVRGLVEKEIDPRDSRRYIYKPTFDLLSYLGVTNVEQLPDYAEVKSSIEGAAKSMEEAEKKDEETKTDLV